MLFKKELIACFTYGVIFFGKLLSSNQLKSWHFLGSIILGSPCHFFVVKKKSTLSSLGIFLFILWTNSKSAGSKNYPCLLLCFSNYGLFKCLSTFKVSCRKTIITIKVFRIISSRKKNFILFYQNQIYRWYYFKSFFNYIFILPKNRPKEKAEISSE